MSQFLDSLQTPFGTMSQHQHAYKAVHMGQPVFGFQPAGQTTTDQHSVYGLSSQDAAGIATQQKSAYYPQEKNVPKELSLTFSPSSLTSQTSPLDTSPKSWGLSNFVSMQSSPFNSSLPPDLSSELSSHSQPILPPPAHNSASRHQTIPRNPYETTDPFLQVKHEKSRSIQHSVSSLHNVGPRLDPHVSTHSLSSAHASHQTYTSSQLIEDLSLPQQKYSSDGRHDITGLVSSGYGSVSMEPSRYTSSQITAELDYDPVSPATPITESHQQSDHFNTMSLQDLATLDSPDKNPISHFGMLPNDSSLLLISEQHSKVNSVPGQHDARNSRYNVAMPTASGEVISRTTQSPLGQSSISIGSPQASVSIASPSGTLTNPSVVHLAAHSHKNVCVGDHQSPSPNIGHQLPVQAIADSTTKPPKRRGRKKKELATPQPREHIDTAKVYQDSPVTPMSHSPGYSQHSSLQAMGNSMSPEMPQHHTSYLHHKSQTSANNVISEVPRQGSYLSSQSHHSPENLVSGLHRQESYLERKSLASPENLTSELPRHATYLGNKSQSSPENLISDVHLVHGLYLGNKSLTSPENLISDVHRAQGLYLGNKSEMPGQAAHLDSRSHTSPENLMSDLQRRGSYHEARSHHSPDNLISDLSQQGSYLGHKLHSPAGGLEHQNSANSAYMQHQQIHQDDFQKSLTYSSVLAQRVSSPTETTTYVSTVPQNAIPPMSVGNQSLTDSGPQFTMGAIRDRDSLSESVIRKTSAVVTERIDKTHLPIPNQLDSAISEPDFAEELCALNQNSLESYKMEKHQSNVMNNLDSVMNEENGEIRSKSVDSFTDTPADTCSSKQSPDNGLISNNTEVNESKTGSIELESRASLVDTLQSSRQELESPSLQSTSLQTSIDSIMTVDPQVEFGEGSVRSLEANHYNLSTTENPAFYSPLSEEPIIGSMAIPQHCEIGQEYQNNFPTILSTENSGYVANLRELTPNTTSTIDESMLSSLMTDQFSYKPGHDRFRYRTKAEQKIMPPLVTTITSDVWCDDDFTHLSRPPPEKNYSANTKIAEVKRTCKSVTKSIDFQNSFLSFLSGKRQETLSSLTSSVIGKKPQLPKYIPEVPRIVSENSNSGCSSPRPDADSRFEDSMNSRPNSPSNFLDEKDGTQSITVKPVQEREDAVSSLENDSQKCVEKPSLKICISKQLLTAKARKSKSKSPKTLSPAKCRRSSASYQESDEDDERSLEEEYFVKQSTVKPKPVSRRQTSARKAKERNRQKKKHKSELFC